MRFPGGSAHRNQVRHECISGDTSLASPHESARRVVVHGPQGSPVMARAAVTSILGGPNSYVPRLTGEGDFISMCQACPCQPLEGGERPHAPGRDQGSCAGDPGTRQQRAAADGRKEEEKAKKSRGGNRWGSKSLLYLDKNAVFGSDSTENGSAISGILQTGPGASGKRKKGKKKKPTLTSTCPSPRRCSFANANRSALPGVKTD